MASSGAACSERACSTSSARRRRLRAWPRTTSGCPQRPSSEPGVRLPPDLVGHLDDQPQLLGLLLASERVALHGGGEAALRRETELVDVEEAGGLVDPAPEQVAVFEL